MFVSLKLPLISFNKCKGTLYCNYAKFPKGNFNSKMIYNIQCKHIKYMNNLMYFTFKWPFPACWVLNTFNSRAQ